MKTPLFKPSKATPGFTFRTLDGKADDDPYLCKNLRDAYGNLKGQRDEARQQILDLKDRIQSLERKLRQDYNK